MVAMKIARKWNGEGDLHRRHGAVDEQGEDGALEEELGDDEGEESEHGCASVPSLRFGREGAEAARVGGLSGVEDGH